MRFFTVSRLIKNGKAKQKKNKRGKVVTKFSPNQKIVMEFAVALKKDINRLARLEAELADVTEKRKEFSAKLERVWKVVKICIKKIDEV